MFDNETTIPTSVLITLWGLSNPQVAEDYIKSKDLTSFLIKWRVSCRISHWGRE